jgi:hypothetical protein
MFSLAKSSIAKSWMMLLALAFCAEGLFLALYVQPGAHAIDYYHIHYVPQAVRRGLDVYDAGVHPVIVAEIKNKPIDGVSERQHFCESINRRLYSTGFCPTATPFLYTIHAAHSMLPFDLGYWLFQILATAACFAGLYLTARASGLGPTASWLCIGLGTSFCWGLLLDGQLANVSRFQILGLGLAIAAARWQHPLAAFVTGLVLSLGCAYKPTMVPALMLWVTALAVDRRWSDLVRGISGTVVGAVVGLAAPLALFGTISCWGQWRTYAGVELAAMIQTFFGNYSLVTSLIDSGLLWAHGLPWILGGALIGALACTAGRRAPTPEAAPLRYSLAITVGPLWLILSSPLVWIQYTALVLPLLVVLVGAWANGLLTGRLRTAALWVGLALGSGAVLRFVPDKSVGLEAATIWAGCLILFGLTVVSFGVLGRPRGSALLLTPSTAAEDRLVRPFVPADWARRSGSSRAIAVARLVD